MVSQEALQPPTAFSKARGDLVNGEIFGHCAVLNKPTCPPQEAKLADRKISRKKKQSIVFLLRLCSRHRTATA
jgi:hypothetical protein